jgi:hypothetical protein
MPHSFPESVSTRKDLKEWILESGISGGWEIVDHKGSDFGKSLWVVIRPIMRNPRIKGDQSMIMLYRMEKVDDKWGYVEMEEGVCGNHVDCPASLLESVGPAPSAGVQAWRDRVKQS